MLDQNLEKKTGLQWTSRVLEQDKGQAKYNALEMAIQISIQTTNLVNTDSFNFTGTNFWLL
jgi:hypothetical protein